MINSKLNSFSEALHCGNGQLDAWLEVHSEAECRTAIHALVAAERERWAQVAAVAVQELAGCATWTQGGVTCQALRDLLGNA